MVRREKNVELKYELILGAQKADVTDADSSHISEVAVQFKYCVWII